LLLPRIRTRICTVPWEPSHARGPHRRSAIWATGEFWWQIPRTVQVVLEGQLAAGVSGKDVIVTLCGLYNREEVLNAAVEFAGPGVASLSMDARLSIANMSTEWGALVGWFRWVRSH